MLEDKVEKNTQLEQQSEKRLKKNEDSLREIWGNMKYNTIHIIGLPEREERAEGQKTCLKE